VRGLPRARLLASASLLLLLAVTAGRPPRRAYGRPTAAAAAALAERILEVATLAFLADGYAAASIETIAGMAGVAKRTLYARWRDKPTLFRAVLERLMARWLASPVPPGKLGGLPVAGALSEALLQTARRALAVALEPDALALHRLLIAESGRFPELAEMVRQSGAATGIARIAALLAREIIAGRLAPLDPGFAAEQFLHLVLAGPQRRALGLGRSLDPPEVEAWARQAVALFLNGCRPPAASR
jgi:TetR/AcrR family transcriptional repressor of mexJK operon